ncbi:MAG: GNAT family N-acetyltransferase [Haloferacaceae archaeon]|jgi:Acetyltransferase, GNAT family
MSDVPTVREPQPEEVDALADLWVDLAADQRRHGSHLAAAPNRDTARDLIAGRVVAGGVRVAAADELVGFVTFVVERGAYQQDATRGLVHDLYVTPAWRDAGLGSRLLTAAEDALADDGAEVVVVEALADNEAARRLYERHGYDPHRIELERTVDDGSDTDTSDG